MADVDFVFFDVTNNVNYSTNIHTSPNASAVGSPAYAFLDTLLEYQNQGWDVPKVVFYTNNKSGTAVEDIYSAFYTNEKYSDLWFSPAGKPMIVGTTDANKGASDQSGDNFIPIRGAMLDYFDVRESQWPNRPSKDWGFPWMDWSTIENRYYPENKVVNVNVAQHGHTETSYSAGDPESSRGYNESEGYVEENWAAGRNIEDQWETVLKYDNGGKPVEIVTASCWNEWLAWKYTDGKHVQYIDNFDNEHSRDMEMDKEYYKDNFYLQLVRNVRRYKYGTTEGKTYTWTQKTPTGFADFNNADGTYKDMVGDARKRDFWGFDIRDAAIKTAPNWYTDNSNRNDIAEVAVLHDDTNIYFRVTTKDDITAYEGGENWMNLLIETQDGGVGKGWEGYNYVINRAPEGGKASVEVSTGGWAWSKVGLADMKIEGNRMMITVPRALLGLSQKAAFKFKAADNVTEFTDIMDYYISGDSAPIGRLNYSYGY
jgi:hypothetical protein